MTLAYVVSRFPVITETFILNEIRSLQDMGWPIEVFALRHMRDTVMHATARQLQANVHFPRLWSGISHGLRRLTLEPETAQQLIRMTLTEYSSARALGKAILAL